MSLEDAVESREHGDQGRTLIGQCLGPLAGTAKSFPLHLYGVVPDIVAGVNTQPESFIAPALRYLFETDARVSAEVPDLAEVLLQHPSKHPRFVQRIDSFWGTEVGFGHDAVKTGDLALARAHLLERLEETGDAGLFPFVFDWFQRLCASLVRSERAHISDGHAEAEFPGLMTHTRTSPKVGRNDQCPCMSGAKFKKCCGRTP